jgi:hypothetical protein
VDDYHFGYITKSLKETLHGSSYFCKSTNTGVSYGRLYNRYSISCVFSFISLIENTLIVVVLPDWRWRKPSMDVKRVYLENLPIDFRYLSKATRYRRRAYI